MGRSGWNFGGRIGRALAGAAVAALLAAGARADTLADTLASAYESSGLIEQNRAVLRAADEDVAQAVSTLRPVVNWVAGLSARGPRTTDFFGQPASDLGIGNLFDLSANVGLQASLTLFDGGARELGVEAQKEIVLATREQLLNAEQQVLLNAVQAYQEVRRSQAFITLRQNNVRVITQELRAARDRFEVGEVTRTDVALAEAQLAAAQSQLAAEEGNLQRAVEQFRAAVGRDPGDLAAPQPASIPGSEDEARAIARVTHPAIRQSQHEVAAAEIAIGQAEAQLSPTVSLSSQFTVTADGSAASQRNATSFGVQASGPLYAGGRLASQVRQFMARRDAARGSLLTTTRQVDQAVGNAYASLEVARAGGAAFQQQVRAATIAFEGVREEATLGARTTLDVLDAEQDLLDARANLVSSQIDEVVASYQVLSAAGLLTAGRLGLGVQLYDPSAYYDLVDDAPTRRSEQGEALDRVLEAIGEGN